MRCTHCGGLVQTFDRILDMQLQVTIDRCLICCREIERGHTPAGKPPAAQGRRREEPA